ncbi:permease [Bacillus haynesii]|uniref:permease n=1 Tax=Bacillus haynesii TaxID=1925021 RepID=UPI001F3C6E3B|nr:permease [Bacillus haynesii]UIN44409.1 permease [Bacillus licheniformis]MCY7965602.1 permease [Bacillus haynesii]MCY8393720.1 permease [Bacillus haynesii]MCY8400400.1 permease [Bacillus haynesii]MCY8577208.1 permease [Bacillus haynesii]
MFRSLNSYLIDFTGLVVIGVLVCLVSAGGSLAAGLPFQIPASVQQLNTIFISILIEALPFVLIGVLIAGFIQIFVTEEHIRSLFPKNRFSGVIVSCLLGACFPACECGIVPIVRRLVSKGVPIYAGVGFLLTGPLINPIVILSTYMAFGNDLRMAVLRVAVGFAAAVVIAFAISMMFRSSQLKTESRQTAAHCTHSGRRSPFSEKLFDMLKHAVDEFFDMGRFLIIGALVAALVQTYLPLKSLFLFGGGMLDSALVMMGLAYFLSLCSEADAFIGASFTNLFPSTSILAFLVYGPMLDLKNTVMMLHAFKPKFVICLSVLITVVVYVCIKVVSLL